MRTGTIVAACLGLAAFPAAAADTYTLDLSLDTSPAHVRNEAMRVWVDRLNKESDGRLVVRVFDSASKYKGANVPTALAQGALDMGAPAHAHLTRVIPEFGVLLLPMFYGATPEQAYAVMDGEIGQELNRRAEEKLGVKVIGRHIDLGYNHIFTVDKPINTHADLKGLTMRVPPGAAHVQRMATMGANPVSIPWSEAAQALQRGTIDGTVSTFESVRSAKLWDAGLKHAYADRQAFVQYVPMISRRAWDALPADLQEMIVRTWEESIDDARQVVTDRQASGVDAAREHGITVVEPTAEDLAAMREKLMEKQPQIVEDLKMDPAFVERARKALDAAG